MWHLSTASPDLDGDVDLTQGTPSTTSSSFACARVDSLSSGLIHTLKLQGCKGVSDAGLRAVAATCGGELRYLDVSGCHLITDAGVSAVAAGCVRLEHLNIGISEAVSDASMTAMAAHSRRLQHLNVRRIRISNAGIIAIAKGCVGLRAVDASVCRGGLRQWPPTWVLHAYGCDALTDVSMVALASHCPRLKDVNVSGCEVGDEGIIGLARHCALVTLRASGCKHVTDVSMAAIDGEPGPQLVGLAIMGCRAVKCHGHHGGRVTMQGAEDSRNRQGFHDRE
eukprot:jgi/Mesvir1/16982/Mv12239-RA.1